MIPFSVLDLSPITGGASAADALRNTLDLARHAERLGYRRYWLAEHHNMPGIASSATAVVIGHVAAGTQAMRVGSGGIMLPNHAPLVIAEQFGTLESLFPGRIDLGLGRAPGTDMMTARALRRDLGDSADRFAEDVAELRAYLAPAASGQRIRAIPGEGLDVPIWLLGSSLYSAQLAAMLGMPFAFASHFAPALLMQALELYRSRFEPSKELKQPYAMLGVNVIAADTDREAARLFTSLQQSFINLRRGRPGQLPPPIDDLDSFASPAEQAQLQQALACSVVGGREAVKEGLAAFIQQTLPDELIISGHIFNHDARLRSFAITAEVRDALGRQAQGPGLRGIG
jgi:luciferase family oxidoreductase group 1